MEHWTEQRLQDLIVERLDGRKLIAVSNREPYIHTRENGKVRCSTPASGMTTALDPMLRASGGVWVANGSGNADREMVDRRNRVRVPPQAPSYTLRRVWLTARIADEYYNGMANGGLWPLCHNAFHRPHFNRKHWDSYRKANETFAEAVLDEAGGEPAVVFIQDYHLALLPRMLKRENPNLTIAQFWHIPWPNRETFQTFPWKEELLDGLLGNDLLGFHVRQHCTNFLDTVDWSLEALVDSERGTIVRGGHSTMVKPFPIGIDAAGQAELAASEEAAAAEGGWRTVLGGTPELLGIGIDRIDYTKGIPDRLEALDRVLEERPEYVGRLTFLQVGVPSRTEVGDYEALNSELVAQVERLNRKWARGTWKPLVLVRRNVDQCDLAALHLMADFCIVSSLHDGMNLVAKEFVGSRIDGDGVLVLSEFTGAARELADAVIVNPFSVDDMAEGIFRAIEMPAHERRRRMNRMRAVVAGNNVYRWAGKLIGALTAIDTGVAERAQAAGDSIYLAGVA